MTEQSAEQRLTGIRTGLRYDSIQHEVVSLHENTMFLLAQLDKEKAKNERLVELVQDLLLLARRAAEELGEG